MTVLQWQQFEATIAQMTPEEKGRLVTILRKLPSDENSATSDPLLGLMSDEASLIDQVVADAFAARETHPLRVDN